MNVHFVNCKDQPRTIGSLNIPVGTVFSGKIADHMASVFLRTYSGVVDLKHPSHDWFTSHVTVTDYIAHPQDSVKLMIG